MLRIVQVRLPRHPADNRAEEINEWKAWGEIDDLKDEQLDKSRCHKREQDDWIRNKGIY